VSDRNILPNAEEFARYWQCGCGPTVNRMVIEWWQSHGAPGIWCGYIASPGHIADYWVPYDPSQVIADRSSTDPDNCHPDDCFADDSKTSRSARGNRAGWTRAMDIDEGLQVEAKRRGYPDAMAWNAYYDNVTLDDVREEIDGGRPFTVLGDTSGSGHTNHWWAVFGYDFTDPTNPFVLIADTYGTTIRWIAWRAMAAGVPWGA